MLEVKDMVMVDRHSAGVQTTQYIRVKLGNGQNVRFDNCDIPTACVRSAKAGYDMTQYRNHLVRCGFKV